MLMELTQKAARKKHFFSFETRLGSFEKLVRPNEPVIWFDGLGLEWMGLIKGIVSEYKDVRMDFQPVRVNLPSVTSTNMTDDEGTQKFRQLDQMAHSYDYTFPDNFLKEIEYVSSSFRTIIEGLGPKQSLLVTSDHGLTLAGFNNETIKGLSDVKPQHWGRDAEFENSWSGSELSKDHFISDGNRLFLATHGRLFGGAGVRGQIHGGATLEEALVPIIRLTRIAETRTGVVAQPPEIIESKIRLDRHGDGVLRFKVFGDPKTVHVRIANRRLHATPAGDETWEVKLGGFNAGPMEGHIEQDGSYAGSINFEATKGIKEIDLGF